MKPAGLSEEDFKAEGHACAITLPAVKELEEGIDFSADEAAKAYFQQTYQTTLADAPKAES